MAASHSLQVVGMPSTATMMASSQPYKIVKKMFTLELRPILMTFLSTVIKACHAFGIFESIGQ